MSRHRSEPPSAPAHSGLLGAIANAGLRYPKELLALAIVAVAVSGVVAWDLPVSTSRYQLIAADHPVQARMDRFFTRFGYPDSMVVVITGEDASARRRAVNQLSVRLEKHPELRGRVLGRVGLKQIAEVLLLIQPEALTDFAERLGDEYELAELIEGGLPAWINGINAKLSDGLDGRDDGPEGAQSMDQVAAGMDHLAMLLRAADAQLAGEDGAGKMPSLAKDATLPRSVGVDEHGYVVGEGDKYHLVALFPALAGAEGHEVKPLVDEIRRSMDEVYVDDVTLRLTGLPALGADELGIIKRGLWQTSLATSLVILLLLYSAFRSLRCTLLALLPLGVGAVLTLAVIRPIFGGLNLVTSSFISVLLALGIDFGVYLMSRYGELVRAGANTKAAITGALAKAGPGMLIGAVTTVIAFLMTTTTEFTAYSELGLITSIGLVLMVLVTFLLLPALLWLAGRGQTIRSPELPGIAQVPGLVRRRHRWILAATVLLMLAGVPLWKHIDFNPRYFDFLPEDTESARALRQIEGDEAVSPILAGATAHSVAEARALTKKLRALPTVAAVQTATDLLPELDAARLAVLRAGFEDLDRDPDFGRLRDRARPVAALSDAVEDLGDTLDEVGFALRQAGEKADPMSKVKKAVARLQERIASMEDGDAKLVALEHDVADILERAWRTARAVAKRGHYQPSDLPEVFKARFASKDGQSLAVYANPAGNIWDRTTAQRFTEEVTAVAPDVAGTAINIYEHMRMIRDGFLRASVLSAVFVLLVLLVGFRRLDDALVALVPVVVGSAWLLGFMGAFGIDFDVANIVVLPLLIGIGVDAGAHMTHRWRESAALHGGEAKLDDIVRGTGAAVLLASLTTGAGFAALMMGDYGGMKSLGMTMSLGIASCLLASVLVLPSVLALLGRAR